MSNLVHPNIRLVCNNAVGTIRQYLWFVEQTAIQLAAKQVTVDAQIVAGEKVTGYLAASADPSLQLAPGVAGAFIMWGYPQTIFAFVVACSVDDEVCTRALDVVAKWAGDGW